MEERSGTSGSSLTATPPLLLLQFTRVHVSRCAAGAAVSLCASLIFRLKPLQMRGKRIRISR